MQDLREFIRTRQKINLMLVLTNVVVFIVLNVIGNTEDARFMVQHGASFTPLILENGEYYRLVTCMFLHFSVQHLVYNMLLLLFLGDSVEKELGKIKYFILYFGGGIIGNLVSLWVEMRGNSYAVSAGASGAIFAVVGAVLWIVLRNKGQWAGYSMRRIMFMIFLTIMDGFSKNGVDNSAHIGGLIGGILLGMILYRRNNTTYLRRNSMFY